MSTEEQQEQAQASERQRYPWPRALMLIVLYGALLVFLWHFPTEAGRAFFQSLFKGFLYLLAGLVMVGITFLFFIFFPLPDIGMDDEDFLLEEVLEEDGRGWQRVYTAHALMVPALKVIEEEQDVWDVLYDMESELAPDCTIAVDNRTGIITIAEEDVDEADFLLDEIKSRLRQAKIIVRTPR